MTRTYYFLLLGGILACCTPMDMFHMESIDYSVTHWETADFSSLTKFDPMMENFETIFSLVLDKKLIFRVAAISYPTVCPDGEHVTASGLVYHPINKKSKGVIDFLPMAHLNRDGGTSEELYAAEGMLALLGYTVIVPDLIGSGASKDKIVPFLMVENTGRVAYDMRRAAAQYLWDEFRYELPQKTTILGYSLGGSAALAAQKYYEAHHPHSVKVKEVHAGGGAYDLSAAFAAYAQAGVSEYPAIPHTILAFDHYYKLDLDFSYIFSGDLLENDNYRTWLHGEYDAAILKDLLGYNLHSYMHEDFFKPMDQQNDMLKKLHPLLPLNSVSEGWRPKAPIYLYHSKSDVIVPFANAEVALRKLRRVGANISLVSYPGDHYTVGYLYFIRSILRFL
ncbi:MAG: alpha/beta hydrolase [Bacteroidales bacterium]|nr:alpha/beta hydrolase [Bacteroidales bacterium]